jgi:hypothetical protein
MGLVSDVHDGRVAEEALNNRWSVNVTQRAE